MKRYNLRQLMKKAWTFYRQGLKKAAMTFSAALKLAWQWIKVQTMNAAKVEAKAAEMGIEEEAHSWAGWKVLGRMVMHTAKAAFKVEVADPTTKTGIRVKSYFIYSDTQPLPRQ